MRQGEQLVYTASETIPTLQQQIEQTENQISLLLGKNPGEVVRGKSLTEQEMPPEVPAGLPSRSAGAPAGHSRGGAKPDRRQCGDRCRQGSLLSANQPFADFWAGRARSSRACSRGRSAIWNFTPQVAQPLYVGGRLKSEVKLSQAQRDSALIQYEKTIQTAFTEVSNALIAHQRVRESRVQQELLVAALQDRKNLAYVRYRGGVDTLLNALDSDRDLFQAELDLSRIRLNELDSVVELYKALGGGWQ